MAAVGQTARLAPRTRRRAVEWRGVLWIAVVAALLAGVVALNVAVLRLNVQLEGLDQERARLRAEKAELVSRLAADLSSSRVYDRATLELGLVRVDATETSYIHLGGP
jgi:cell division protein FtsB